LLLLFLLFLLFLLLLLLLPPLIRLALVIPFRLLRDLDLMDFLRTDLRTDLRRPPRMIRGVHADPTPPLKVVSGFPLLHVGSDGE
jgi:hypothetical protein